MVRPKLSILICSLESRKLLLDRLMQCLQPQLSKCDGIELLTNIDNGEVSIGTKRNQLLQKASGDYVAFIDDDDLVADDYTSRVLSGIESGPDVVSFPVIVITDGIKVEFGFVSTAFHSWFEVPDPFKPGLDVFFACPNHILPVRRELALGVRFPPTNEREDYSYSLRLRERLTNEVYIETPMYYYLRRSEKSSAEKELFPAVGEIEALQNELESISMNELRHRKQLGIVSPKNRPTTLLLMDRIFKWIGFLK